MAHFTEGLDYARIAHEEQSEALQRARERTESWKVGAFVAGRLFLGAVFVGSAVDLLVNYGATLASLQETLVDVHRLVPVGLALQLGAGVALAVGYRARLAAFVLAAYLVATLLLVPPDLSNDLGRAVGFATLGLLSALAMLAAHGAGRLSVDHLLRRRRLRKLNAARSRCARPARR